MLVASLNTVLAGIAPEALDITANVMVAGGLAVFIAMMFRHAWRYGVDPFHGAPVRGSRITPMLVLLPFTGFFVASLVLQPVAELYKDEPAEEVVRLSCNSLSQALGAMMCLWAGACCFRGRLHGFLIGRGGAGLRMLGTTLLYLIIVGGVCELAAELTRWAIWFFEPAYRFEDHRVIEALRDQNGSPGMTVVLWAGAIIAAPIAEECFFRGLLQTLALRVSRRRWAAILFSAVLFGLAHGNQPHVIPALILFGVILGYQYERSGGLIGPIILHALFNLKTLVWLTLTQAAGAT